MPTLHWIGKDKVINHHMDVPFRVLEHSYGFDNGKQTKEETGSGNKIIHGDNLEALKSLLPEYEGKIKCIYIDPPYNTGNESWIYNDNVNDPKIKKWLGQVVGKEAEDLTRHDKWLCMMYPRLKLLYKLLADDGAIFISCDDNEQANLKLVCDEIFGLGNFIANVAVVNNLKGRSDDKFIATAHESLIIYQKGKFVTNGVPVPEEYVQEYRLSDDNGNYRLQGLRKRGSGAKRVDRPNMFYPFFYDRDQDKLSVLRNTDTEVEILPKLSDGEDGRWRWGKDTAGERIGELTAQLVRGRNEFDVFQKDYLSTNGQDKSIKPKSFWIGSEFSSEAGTLQLKKIFNQKSFQTPKSVDFIHFILHQATNKDSIVLDSFAGSGTTAHAVLNINTQDGGRRKFICIEMESYAEDITAERVKRVIKGYGEVQPINASFDYYTLGQPMFLENGNLNELIGPDKIRKYIYYTETKTALKKTENKDSEYFLNKHNDTAYYFIYEQDGETTLDKEFLENIKTTAEQFVIYADNCLLTKEYRTKHHIIFKKIPRDITRF